MNGNSLEILNLLHLFRLTVPTYLANHFPSPIAEVPTAVLEEEVNRFNPLSACVVNPKTLRPLVWNQSYAQVFGQPHPYDFSRQPEMLLQMVHYDDIRLVLEFLQQLTSLKLEEVSQENLLESNFNLRFRYRLHEQDNWSHIQLQILFSTLHFGGKTYLAPTALYQDISGMHFSSGLSASLAHLRFNKCSNANSLAPQLSYTNLSDQETRIIELIIQGFHSADIAEQLHLSANTVRQYRKRILNKTGCKNRAELVRYLYARN